LDIKSKLRELKQ